MVRTFLRAPGGVLSLFLLGLLLVVMLFAPSFIGTRAFQLDLLQTGQNPSLKHMMGTDALGRDILLRIVVATRLSIGLGLAATAVGAVIGIPAGTAAVLLPRRLRSLALRTIDALLAFPGLLVAIFVGAIIGPSAFGAALGVGIATSISFARLSSAMAMSIGGKEYVAAARVVGIRPRRILLRYLLANSADTLAITIALSISGAIVAVSSLSFLGLGVQPPDFDWGQMLTYGVQAIYETPAAALAPAAAIAVSALAFGFVGEAVARAANPILWTQTPDSQVRVPTAHGPVGHGVRGQFVPTRANRSPGKHSVLEVEHLAVTFRGRGGTGPTSVVNDVSFAVWRGQMLGIVGESGSGKTMTAMALAQLIPSPGRVTGSVSLDGVRLDTLSSRSLGQQLGTKVGIVFQDPNTSLNPALRIGIQLTEVAERHRHLGRTEAKRLAAARLREVNIPAPEQHLRRYPHELSGGMRQRSLIAMSLMNDPLLLIADEPTTALDVTIQAQIMDVLRRINQERGAAVILISHNLALISENCERVLVMYAGSIVEELSRDQLVTNALHPYTRALLQAAPDMSQDRRSRLSSIPGQAPDLSALPTGCPFHPRCPLAVARCSEERPPLVYRPGENRRVACWVANKDITATVAL